MMLPHHEFLTYLHLLAKASEFLIACPETPEVVRRALVKAGRKIRKKLPRKALMEVMAADVGSAIKASDYLRRDFTRSSSSGAGPKT